MEEPTEKESIEPSDAVCGERFNECSVCRNGNRVEFTMSSATGNAFGGYLSPSLAAKLGRELVAHAAAAFAELRKPKESV